MVVVTLVGRQTEWLTLGEALAGPALEVQVIEDAEDALDPFVLQTTRLFVADMDLDAMDTGDFIRAIRAAGSQAPVLIAAPVHQTRRLALLEAGASGLLRIPVDGLEFVTAVYAYLAADQARPSLDSAAPPALTSEEEPASSEVIEEGGRSTYANHDFLSALQEEIGRAAGSGAGVCIYILHAGGISEVNQDLGFSAGDRMIAALSSRFDQFAAEHGLLAARIAGDEFALLYPAPLIPQDVAALADRIVALCDEPVEIAGERAACLPSVGVAVFPRDGLTAEDLRKAATGAMWQALAAGQDGRICHAGVEIEGQHEPENLSKALEKALADDALDLYYQTQIALSTGSYCAVEAFVRWPRPDRGDVRPQDLFAAAGEGQLLETLTRWIARRAADDGKRLKAAGLEDLKLVINLSHAQALLADIGPILAVLRGQGDGLPVELAFPAPLAQDPAASATLQLLQRQGFDLCMRLPPGHQPKTAVDFPISRIKIDIEDDSDFAPLAAIAKSYGRPVIGANIEQASQLGRLRQLQLDAAQGYYIQSPVSILQLIALCRGN
jgi:diguanylate cyclase (GGDEF)-like protein